MSFEEHRALFRLQGPAPSRAVKFFRSISRSYDDAWGTAKSHRIFKNHLIAFATKVPALRDLPEPKPGHLGRVSGPLFEVVSFGNHPRGMRQYACILCLSST